MHPILGKVWRYSLIGLSVAEILSQLPEFPHFPSWRSIPFVLAIFVLFGLLISEVLIRMGYFEAIKLKRAKLLINTDELHAAISDKKPQANALFEVEIDYVLSYGGGGIKNNIEIKLDDDVLRALLPHINARRQFSHIEFDKKPKIIKLTDINIPKTIRHSKIISIKSINKQLVDGLDEASKLMYKGHYRIIWYTAQDKKRIYKPKEHRFRWLSRYKSKWRPITKVTIIKDGENGGITMKKKTDNTEPPPLKEKRPPVGRKKR